MFNAIGFCSLRNQREQKCLAQNEKLMLNSFRKLSNRAHGEVIQNSLFFVLFFFFVWLWVDPRLIYYGHGYYLEYRIYVPGMMTTFSDLPAYPGKAVE